MTYVMSKLKILSCILILIVIELRGDFIDNKKVKIYYFLKLRDRICYSYKYNMLSNLTSKNSSKSSIIAR